MERVLISELGHWMGKDVVLKGWVHRLRYLSNVVFLILRDRTGEIQVVIDPKLLHSLSLSTESVVEVRGVVTPEPRARAGYEVAAQHIKVLSRAAAELPLTINGPSLDASLETILDNRTLSLRHEKVHPIFKIQAALVHGFQKFLNKKGFVQVFTPKIVKSGTEGGTELFSVQYFQEKAYLAQSPQFYKQMMVGAGYERVYEVGHVYRAERHATSRHLNEYISLDLEVAFIDSEEDLMELENELLDSMFSYVAQHCSNELKTLGVVLPTVPQIPRIPLKTASKILAEVYSKTDLNGDLDPEGERLVCQYIKETRGSDFVFITSYPWEKRPMYTMPKENGLTGSFDLLFRGLEITTGGQRIHDYAQLRDNMIKKGLNPIHFEDYLVNFKQGMPPHGGLAIGLERLTAQMLGLKNVREASLFPRDRHRLTP